MAQFDLYHNIAPVQTIAPQTVNGTVDGAGVDLSGFLAVLFEINAGTISGTDPTVTIKLQESDDNVTFTDIADSDLLGGSGTITINENNDDQVYRRGYMGMKRYVRAVVSAVGGTGTGLPLSVTVIKGRPRHAPVE